jgi:hypothetical protein
MHEMQATVGSDHISFSVAQLISQYQHDDSLLLLLGLLGLPTLEHRTFCIPPAV